jgi:hypothetical protein
MIAVYRKQSSPPIDNININENENINIKDRRASISAVYTKESLKPIDNININENERRLSISQRED